MMLCWKCRLSFPSDALKKFNGAPYCAGCWPKVAS